MPSTTRALPSGHPAVECCALPLGSTCAVGDHGEGGGGGVGRVAITEPVKSVIGCSAGRTWHGSLSIM